MGLLDRIVGSRQDRFARQVLTEVRRLGTAEATYHPADFSIAFRRGPGDGEGGVVYLSNVFRECRGASRAERRQRILQLVSSVIAIDQVPDTWAQARGRLRPVLRAVTFGQAEATGRLTLLSRPAFPFLAELVVIDEPTAMAYVTVAQTREWGVPAVEVFEAVHANLTLLAGGSDGLAADRPPGRVRTGPQHADRHRRPARLPRRLVRAGGTGVHRRRTPDLAPGVHRRPLRQGNHVRRARRPSGGRRRPPRRDDPRRRRVPLPAGMARG